MSFRDDDPDRDFDLWDELYWVVGQWICQQRALARVQADEAQEQGEHIEDPGADNHPCDWCYDLAYDTLTDGLRELIQIYGAVAYSCGTGFVPEPEAARRALGAMIARAREIERTKELLAQLTGKDGWRRLPSEGDVRRGIPFREEEDGGASSE